MNRRDFLAWSTAALAGGSWTAAGRFAPQPAEPASAADLVAGKDVRLKVVEARPIVLETPLALLAQERITRNEWLFVRNNVDLPGAATLEPPAAAANRNLNLLKVVVPGAAGETTLTVGMDLLGRMPMVEVEMVLQCSGNSRNLMSARAPIAGTPWGHGGVGNVVFRGPKLATLFQQLRLEPRKEQIYLTADGADAPPGEGNTRPVKDFEHSLPLADCLERSILAVELNGRPLPAIHGGPLRLITPGYFGTNQIKWLTSLTLATEESRQESHARRYRNPLRPIAPGTEYDYRIENSRPNWKMPVKCIVLAPERQAQVAAGTVLVRGVAFNDGDARLDSVLISLDRGETWKRVSLDRPQSKYAWTPWEARVELQAGRHELWARAVDEAGRSQPLDGNLFWNPGGYEWNGVEKVEVAAI